jgi:PAS domain S-box-containing protein
MAFAELRIVPRILILALMVSGARGVPDPPAARSPRTIRVVMDSDYAPYVFSSPDGALQGILIDQWKLWEQKTGIRAEIHAVAWSQALRRMRAGEFDVIDCIVETPERRDEFDFTPPYADVEASIFFRDDISGIVDVASLKGFPVGVKAGDQHIDKLRESGITTLIPFRSDREIIQAAKERKINVFVTDAPSGLYLLNKMGIAAEFRRSAPIFRDQLRRAVRKGSSELLRTVSNGFAAIPPAELKRLDDKWFGHPIYRYGRYLAYAGYAAFAAILLIAGLFAWNRTLRRKILRRTAALYESEQRFRQIAENIHEVFWLATVDASKLLYISPAYESVWGQTCESLYRAPRSYVDGIHPDDRARVLAALQKREHGFEVEYRVVRPDGTVRCIRDRGFPIKDESGHIYRAVGIAEDITDYKQAEEKLRRSESQLAEAQRVAHIGSWDWDSATGTTTASPELYRIFGVEEGDPDIHAKAMASIHPDDEERRSKAFERSVRTREPFEVDYRIVRPDGEERILQTRAKIVSGEDGEPLRMIGTTQDVTELKRAEETLNATNEQLRALSARVQSAREEEGIRIAREIHDELGAALTSLRWDVEGIRKALSDEPERASIASVKAKLAAMLELIDTTVDVVRRIASDLRPGVLDILGLEAAVEWQAQQFQERTGIAVHCQSSGNDVALDAEQSTAVFRIFQEALTNVLRHARATRVDVSMVADAQTFLLSVGDNGRGIREDEKNGRLSIGLLGMQERAHLMGGEIEVSGVDGEGTTVTLRLPMDRVKSSAHRAPSRP